MPSLLDLPETLLWQVGVELESHLPDLSLYLLVHSRIHASCKGLRYRFRQTIFGSPRKLQEYIEHPLWQQNCHAVMVPILVPRTAASDEDHPDDILDKPVPAGLPWIFYTRQYDARLARVITSLRNLRAITLITQRTSMQPVPQALVALEKSIAALVGHAGIREITITGYFASDHLRRAFDIVSRLRSADSVCLEGNIFTQNVGDVYAPLGIFLGSSFATAHLRRFSLSSSFFYRAQSLLDESLSFELPELEELDIVETSMSSEECGVASSFLQKLLSSSRRLRRAHIDARVFTRLATAVSFPDLVHLELYWASYSPVDYADYMRPHLFPVCPHVRYLSMAGLGALDFCEDMLRQNGDDATARQPFPNLKSLELNYNMDRLEYMEMLELTAGRGIVFKRS